jgi:transcriptional antiterminator RfaH
MTQDGDAAVLHGGARSSETAVDGEMACDKVWLALYTKPFKEYKVRNLLSGRGIEVYLPEITVQQRSGRKNKPFFPHYLFARLDPSSGVIADVRWTPGLRYIVRAGNRPVPVPDEVVEHIRRRLAKMGVVRPEERFKEGDLVRIGRGPLQGLEAIFDRRLSAEGRVRVFLQLVNRLVATELNAGDLLPPN